MTFGKDQDAKECGRKGALVSNRDSEKQRKAAHTRWANKEYRENLQLSMRKSKAWSIEHLTKMGRMSRKRENDAINNVRSEYDKIFLPQEVCDRIAVKDGKIFFIEVKDLKQELRSKQKEFKEISKDNYIVIRSP